MSSDALKIAKMQNKQHAMDSMLKLVTTPVVEFAALVLLVREMEKANENAAPLHTWLGVNWFGMHDSSVTPSAVFAIGTGIIAIQALSPLVPTMVAGGTDIIKSLPALALALPK